MERHPDDHYTVSDFPDIENKYLGAFTSKTTGEYLNVTDDSFTPGCVRVKYFKSDEFTTDIDEVINLVNSGVWFRGPNQYGRITMNNKCMVCGKRLNSRIDKSVGECRKCRED
jgi:hypothetical protein